MMPFAQLMDHVIDVSTAAYRGTTHEHDFMIYHDALSAWWEEGAQAHMAARGFKDRQWRCVGETNKGWSSQVIFEEVDGSVRG